MRVQLDVVWRIVACTQHVRQPRPAAAAALDKDDDDDDDGAAAHQLVHYWYSSWPDHQAPRTTHQLLQLVLEVERLRLDSGCGRCPGPVVVHCRSLLLRGL